MKPSTSFLAFLLPLLFAFGFTTASEIILDADGHPVRNGGTYYLFADGRAIINSTNDVVSALVYPGSPISISTLIKPTYLLTDYALILSFTHSPNSNWVVKSSYHVDKPIVVGSLTDSHHLRGSFSFKPHNSEKFEYKLVFTEIIGANTIYKNVVQRGIGEKFGEYEHLVVTDNEHETPAVFKFKKVTDDLGLSMVV